MRLSDCESDTDLVVFRLLQREVPGSLEIVAAPACVVWGRTS